ncbi:hypothetical protein [Streptomyces sp. AC495_CC817]|uniref:hypothetical protein n=1 Tax=Streptomyces sp. AC495_CC817 TaxID=2823900 RepID=UPI001C25BB16|nr:hypothetical protein [Streptomyces sp. AC495_CC817]
MRNHLRPAVAPVLLTAVLTVAGCSSSGPAGTDTPSASTPTRSLSAAERLAGEQDSAGDGSSPAPARSASAGPAPARSASARSVRPDSELKPATGSFTKKEKKYLSGRVPESVEPAAVLEAGQEACQRIERAAEYDKDAAAAAVVSGEIPDAADAITHLCPEQRPVLDAAEGGYPDGTHTDPEPGRYRTVSAGPDCRWGIMDAKGKELDAGSGTGDGKDRITLNIPAGAAEFVSSGCYAWLRARATARP